MSTSCYKKNVFFSLSRLYMTLYMRNSRRFRFVLLANSEFIYNGAFCRPDLEITHRRKAETTMDVQLLQQILVWSQRHAGESHYSVFIVHATSKSSPVNNSRI